MHDSVFPMNDSQHQSTTRRSAPDKNAQSWSQDRGRLSHHDNASRAHSYQPRDARDSISARISPPPLTRQRKEPKVSETIAESSRSKPLPNDKPTSHRKAQHSPLFREVSTCEDEQIRHERSSDSLRQSFTYLKPLLQQEHGQRKHSIGSIDSDGARSGSSTRTGSLSRRTCRVCEKSSATSYNPIITCLGCDRPYHDSCRRPPLIEGVDPKCWRCSKCLTGAQRRVPSNFDAPKQNVGLLSATGVPSRDVTGPNTRTAPQQSLHMPPAKEHKDRTQHIPTSQGINTPYFNIVPTGALIHEEKLVSSQGHDPGRTSDHAKKIEHLTGLVSSSQRPRSRVHDLHKFSNTTTEISRALDTSKINSEQQSPSCSSVVAPDHDAPLSSHISSEKRAALTMLCSECRKQHILVNSNSSSVKCLNCRKKDAVSAVGTSETPALASPRKEHSQTGLQITNSESIATRPLPVQPAPNPWFRSRLVTSKPNVIRKSISDHDTSSASPTSHVTPVNLDNTETVSCETTGELDSELSKSPTTHNREEYIDKNGSITAHSGTKRLNSAVSTSDDAAESTKPTDVASKDAESASLAPRDSDRRYTMRELARIAIVAADRPQLAAMEIIDWLAHSFNYLKKGDGRWEKSIKAALSGYPEFLSRRVDGERALYGFVDGKTRAEYESLYPEYCASSGSFANLSNTRNVRDKSQKHEKVVPKTTKESRPFLTRAVKSAPTPMLKISRNRKPDHIAIATTKRAAVKVLEDDGSLFMPFDRRIAHQPQNLLKIAHEIRRESNFYNITPLNHESSVDRMSQAEKDKKIAEIKARPSRKSFFGPDHVLAHARRYKRQDIHDERDGAWQPKRPNPRDDVSKSDGERSLKELFNLPENAIPMNDGPQGLAFRDGTLINGRLPRPRQIYRVSKLVGVELMVRTS